jgi:hypothetical protein
MSDAELILDLKNARKLLPKKGVKSVEECLPLYKDILVAAYRGELRVDPKYPGEMISELQNAHYMRTILYLTGKGKDFVEKDILIIT